MTRKEAIIKIEALKAFCSENDLKNIGEALDMAISSLHYTVDKEPLTLDQLRDMDGKPVWISDLVFPERSAWRLIYWDRGKYLVLIAKSSDGYILEEYGKTWIAYAYHPTHIEPDTLSCAGCDYLDQENVPCAHCIRASGYADYYKPMDARQL